MGETPDQCFWIFRALREGHSYRNYALSYTVCHNQKLVLFNCLCFHQAPFWLLSTTYREKFSECLLNRKCIPATEMFPAPTKLAHEQLWFLCSKHFNLVPISSIWRDLDVPIKIKKLSLQNVAQSQACVNPPRSESHIVSTPGAQQPALYGFSDLLHPGSVVFLKFGHPGRNLATFDYLQLCWTEYVLTSQTTCSGALLSDYLCLLAVLNMFHNPKPVTAASTLHLFYGSPEWMSAAISPHPTVSHY